MGIQHATYRIYFLKKKRFNNLYGKKYYLI